MQLPEQRHEDEKHGAARGVDFHRQADVPAHDALGEQYDCQRQYGRGEEAQVIEPGVAEQPVEAAQCHERERAVEQKQRIALERAAGAVVVDEIEVAPYTRRAEPGDDDVAVNRFAVLHVASSVRTFSAGDAGLSTAGWARTSATAAAAAFRPARTSRDTAGWAASRAAPCAADSRRHTRS